MDRKRTVQFIHSERISVKERYNKGIYSIEFALGHLSGLLNHATAEGLAELVEDIKIDVQYLTQRQLSDMKRVRISSTDSNVTITH